MFRFSMRLSFFRKNCWFAKNWLKNCVEYMTQNIFSITCLFVCRVIQTWMLEWPFSIIKPPSWVPLLQIIRHIFEQCRVFIVLLYLDWPNFASNVWIFDENSIKHIKTGLVVCGLYFEYRHRLSFCQPF